MLYVFFLPDWPTSVQCLLLLLFVLVKLIRSFEVLFFSKEHENRLDSIMRNFFYTKVVQTFSFASETVSIWCQNDVASTLTL